MKFNFNYIKTGLLIGMTLFLFAFASSRNNSRKISELSLYFTNSENLYVTEEAVNKLLIQSGVKPDSIGKEALDLKRVEAELNAHAMIENAEVYISIDGKLGASITQRKPIARVLGVESYYIDRRGLKMPLSENYSARVPLVTGTSEDMLEEVFPLLDYIKDDEFLSKHITGIRREENGLYKLHLRQLDCVLIFGPAQEMDRKFNNFKAFYQKAMKDNKLNTFKKVDLQFGNQVVATKK